MGNKKDKEKAVQNPPPAPPDNPPPAPPQDPPAPKTRDAMVVANGKSLTSKKGIIDAGEEVKPEFLRGGAETFKFLVGKKLIVEGKVAD